MASPAYLFGALSACLNTVKVLTRRHEARHPDLHLPHSKLHGNLLCRANSHPRTLGRGGGGTSRRRRARSTVAAAHGVRRVKARAWT